MVHLAPHPLKLIDVGDDEPFVAEALRPRKPYEVCWCGSGRKYKKCHRFREEEAPLAKGQMLHANDQVFWQRRACMHPLASPNVCQGQVIDAHTIQRKGPLQQIVSPSNHVCVFRAAEGAAVVEEISWKRASTFPGYCSLHDSRTFGPIERIAFSGSHEQCVLQTYRNVCNELYKKRALIDSMKYQRTVIDRGRDLHNQIELQMSIAQNIAGQTKSMQELSDVLHAFHDAIAHGDYGRFSSKCYFFEGDLCVTSAAALHTEFDFQGRQLADMWDLSIDAEMLAHSVMATDCGGAIVFTWKNEDSAPAAITSSFDAVPDEQKGDIFVQYCFLNSENTFFSKVWWDGLPLTLQNRIRQYAGSLYYEGGAFVANDPPLVNWTFVRPPDISGQHR